MLNFCNFSHYDDICKILCSITLKHHNISTISNIACYFFFRVLWIKKLYDEGVEYANIWCKSWLLNIHNCEKTSICFTIYFIFTKILYFWAIFKMLLFNIALYDISTVWSVSRRITLKEITRHFLTLVVVGTRDQ
jgi:hypothetical protein